MDREKQLIKLKDGRKLGFAEYGDPKGKPLLFFHGWPSSRLAGQKYDSLARKLHIHLITPDRPGYGISDFKKDRTLLDWPDDVVELADYLKIKQFAVMGVSGGGPYAAVCGYKIPNRIIKLGIVVGLGPIVSSHSLDGMMWMSKIGWQNFGKHPLFRKLSAMMQCVNSLYGPSLGLHRFLFGAKADRKEFANDEIRRQMAISSREAFRQGYRGPELDLKLYTNDWGFDVSKIPLKTCLWYGGADQNVSLAMGKYYALHIRGSQLKIYSGEGHLISVTHAPEILKTLIQ